jgi:hypothetical protein
MRDASGGAAGTAVAHGVWRVRGVGFWAAEAFEVCCGFAGGFVLAGGEGGGVGFFGCDGAQASDRGGSGDGDEAAGVAFGGCGEVVEQGCDFGRFEDREQAAE